MRLLLVAPTVDGTDVGEAWVGFQWARRLSERHEVTLLTYRKRNRPSVVPQLPAARVVEWVEPPLVGRNERFNSLLKPGYWFFYLRARRWIRRALASEESFDAAHQPVPVAMRYPSPLAGLPIPYVVGPVGGSLSDPPGFADEDAGPWYTRLRRFDRWRLHHDPWLRRSFNSAAVVLGIAPYVEAALGDLAAGRLRFMPETALEELPDSADRGEGEAGGTRLLFVGRLVRSKGLREAIRAVAEVRDLPITLDVVGDGYDRAYCEQLAESLGVAGRVTFHGRKERAVVEAHYRKADVFLFPSFREPGGNVVFEAMGNGLAMVVSDRGGPGSVVDDSCGFRVPATSPTEYPRLLADAVRQLALDPELRRAMGVRARARVASDGLWDHRIASMEALYEEIFVSAQQVTSE